MHVHTDNLMDHHVVSDDLNDRNPPAPPTPIEREFLGFHRPDGRVGTRNYVAIISTVNCSTQSVTKWLSDSTRSAKKWPNVDGVFAATHGSGCALEYHGIKHQMLGRVLAGYATHCNVGGTGGGSRV